MNRSMIRKLLNSEKLIDVPLLYIIQIISAVVELEYDNENRSKKN